MGSHYVFIRAASTEEAEALCEAHRVERRIKSYSDLGMSYNESEIHYQENITQEYLDNLGCCYLPTAYIDLEDVYFSKLNHAGRPTTTPDIVARKLAVLPPKTPLIFGVVTS